MSAEFDLFSDGMFFAFGLPYLYGTSYGFKCIFQLILTYLTFLSIWAQVVYLIFFIF